MNYILSLICKYGRGHRWSKPFEANHLPVARVKECKRCGLTVAVKTRKAKV